MTRIIGTSLLEQLPDPPFDVIEEGFFTRTSPIPIETYTQEIGPQDQLQILDWKNHMVRDGDVYELIFDVHPTVQAILRGSSVIFTAPISWMQHYKFNPKGMFIELMNKALSAGTAIGILQSKVRIDENNSGFSSDYQTMKVRVKILENAWPLIILISAISLGLYFTIREVRLIYRGYPGKKAGGGATLAGILVLLGLIIVGTIILPQN